MKTLFTLALISFFAGGCVSVQYGDARYASFLKKVHAKVRIAADGTKEIELDSDSNVEMAKALTDAAVGAAIKAVRP